MKITHAPSNLFKTILVLFLIAACGQIPNEPAPQGAPELQEPLLVLPEAFQEIPLTTVQSTTLENSFFGTYYAPPKAAQYFEYKDGFISGHILKF